MIGQLSNLISLGEKGLYDTVLPSARNSNTQASRPFESDSNLGSKGDIDSFSVFTSLLKQSYRKMMFNPQTSGHANTNDSGVEITKPAISHYADSNSTNDKISSREAAGNILKFITQRLKADFAEGASTSELLSRLEAGLEGFEKGFMQAKQQIEGLGLLTPDLESEIADTYSLVTQGIEKIRDVINSKDSVSGELENGVIDAGGVPIAPLHNASSSLVQLDGFKESSFSLKLTTNDGDIVTVNINKIQQRSLSASYNSDEGGSSFVTTNSSSQSDLFELNVVGELDEGELTAINRLLEEVNILASDFYKGNLQQAFNSAKALELNPQELSSLNLELKQTVSIQVIDTYQSSPLNEFIPTESIIQGNEKSLRELLDSVEKILTHARNFASPFELLESITNQLKPIERTPISPPPISQTLSEKSVDELAEIDDSNELMQSINDIARQFDI